MFYFEENFLCKNDNYDIAISRSGASSLAELSHLNIPFISIPYPHATDNHQYLNAKRYFDLNCCWILEEKTLILVIYINSLMKLCLIKMIILKRKIILKNLMKIKIGKNINEIIIK